MANSAVRACLVLVLLILAAPTWAEVSASVDRTEIAMDESFTLTLTVSELRVFSQPDLSPLETDFEIINTSQNSSTSIVNGKLSSSTSWTIQLMPRRPGKTSIPPIEIGDESTHTIELVVDKRGSGKAVTEDDNVVLEAELSRNTAYVSEQVLLTLRVSMAQAARFQLEEPEPENTIVQQVAEASFQQVRGGRRYQVTEYTFALFPNEPGELVIGPLKLVAEMMSSRPRSMFDPMLGQSKRVLRRTEPLTLNVIPAPEGISRVDWLPATEVSLTQQWSKDPAELEVGDSITRTIELKGKGVMASQLPPLFMPKVPGLKMYPDQPTASDDQSAAGITGKRVERIALVATRPGQYELPEQQVQWWDVENNSLETAVLPAVSLEVTGAAAPAASEPLPSPADKPATVPTTQPPPGTPEARAWYSYPLWWGVTGVLLLLCTILALLYRRALLRLQNLPATAADQGATPPPDREEAAYQALQAACQLGQAATVYQALQAWCRQHWQDKVDIDHLADGGANQLLVAQAGALQRQLYSSGQVGSWTPESLLSAVEQQRKQRERQKAGQAQLPPLYGAAP